MRAKPRRQRRRPRSSPGAPPGTLTVDPEAPKPFIRVMGYDQGEFAEGEFAEGEVTDVQTLRDYLARWPVTWVNVDGLGDAETIRRIGELFGLHHLALEDVLTLHQRPKVEEYAEHLFLVVRMLEPGVAVQTEQISMFLGDRFVLTLQEHQGDCLDPIRKRIREAKGRIRTMGADYLAYALLDAVVDAYFPYLDDLSDRVEALEAEVLARPTPETVAKIHEFKRNLLTIRHVISPLREAINALLRDEAQAFSETTRVYLRDCYDHSIQVLEMVETYREVVGGLLDIYLSSVSNRMNEIMKVLTIIGTIFIPLSFLAGVYGMNFDPGASPWNMPELGWRWGYPVFLGLALGVALIELVFFWRRGWLGGDGKGTNGIPSDTDSAESDRPG